MRPSGSYAAFSQSFLWTGLCLWALSHRVLDYVERKIIYKEHVARQTKVGMREQTRKSSKNGLMRGAYNPCDDGQYGIYHRGQASNSAATGLPDFKSIVALTSAALNQQKGGTQPRGRPADKKVNADGTLRC